MNRPTPEKHLERDTDNISFLIENKLRSYLKALEKWFTKIVDI